MVVAGGLALVLTACGGDSINVSGTFTIGPDGVTQNSSAGGECKGYGGYGDITPGAQVVISTGGETVGTGELGEGTYQTGWCSFPFTVDDVPSGSNFYTVEVSGRGGIEYTQEELETELDLGLGS